MDDLEAEDYRIGIVAALREAGFGWIVDEVQSVVSEGRVVYRQATEEPLTLLDEPDVFSPETRGRRPRRTRRPSTEPFTPGEQLALLIDAIDRAVVQRQATDEALLHLAGVTQVTFVPETGDIALRGAGTEATHSLEATGESQRRTVAARISHLLTDIRERLDGG